MTGLYDARRHNRTPALGGFILQNSAVCLVSKVNFKIKKFIVAMGLNPYVSDVRSAKRYLNIN